MASNNRKMLFPNQPGESYTVTFFFPWSQQYSPPPPPPPLPQMDLSVLFFTLISIIASILLFLFLIFFLYLHIMKSRRSSPSSVAPVSTNRREEAGERDFSGYHHVWRITTTGLHRSVINSITLVVFKKEEAIIDGTDCSVCLNEFEEDESLRVLPKCSHAFHVNCIDTWLLSHKNCPLCRSPVFPSTKKTERTHQLESGSSNGEEESSGSRNVNVLPRSQSDLARHCGAGRLVTVRRSFSIGGSSLVKDDVASRSRRQFYSSFSANFFSSTRRSRNQDSVLPNRMPSVSG